MDQSDDVTISSAKPVIGLEHKYKVRYLIMIIISLSFSGFYIRLKPIDLSQILYLEKNSILKI